MNFVHYILAKQERILSFVEKKQPLVESSNKVQTTFLYLYWCKHYKLLKNIVMNKVFRKISVLLGIAILVGGVMLSAKLGNSDT